MTPEYQTNPADFIEQKLKEADHAAESSNLRYTSEEVFQRVRNRILTTKGGHSDAE